MQDAAKVLDVYAGYDPKDELTVFSVGRKPQQPYASFAAARRLDGVRIGVLREYMRRKLFTKADEESIGLIDRAIGDLRELGAVIVDPGADGELFTRCIARYAPELDELGVRATVSATVSRRTPVQAAIRSRRCWSCMPTRRACRRVCRCAR